MMPTAEDLRGARGLWRRFQERRAAGRSRPATDDATDSEPDGLPDPPAEYPHRSLVDRTPFQIGFFGAFGALVAIGLVTAVIALQSVIMMVVMALFLALGLNPPTEALKRRGVPSSIAVAITSLGFVLVLALGIWAVLPVMTQQITALLTGLPSYLNELRQNAALAEIDTRYQIIEKATSMLTSGQWIEGFFGGVLGAGVAFVNVLVNLGLTLVLTVYFLASLPAIKKTIYELAPASRRPRVKYLANEMFDRIGGYVVGLFTVVLLAGVVTFLFCQVSGLGDLAIALAVIVMICWFVPLIGPTLATIAVTIVGLSVSVPTGIAAAIFLLLYVQIDIYLIQPRIYQNSVEVPGALVILAALAGGLLFGMVGAVLAIPVAASLLLLYREVLIPMLDRS